MGPVPDPEFVRNLPAAHFDVDKGIPLVEKIVVPAVDVPAHRLDIVFRKRLDQFDGIVAGPSRP